MALHVALLTVAAWGWQAQTDTKRIVTPRYVEATLVEIKAKAKPAAAKKNKVIDLTAKRRQQENLKRKAEKKRQAALNVKREKDRKAAETKKLKDKQLAEEQRLADEEAERQRLDQQRLQRESAVADALGEEQQMLADEQSESSAQSFSAMIAAKIEQNWSRPPSARLGMKCQLQIQLIPTGEVISVTVIEGSGNAAFDRSAELAVKKVGRFEGLKGMDSVLFERYFRQLTLTFNPKDLRQ